MIPDIPAKQTLAVIEMARNGRFDEVRELFVAPLRPMVSAQALRAAWDAEMARLARSARWGPRLQSQDHRASSW